MNLDSRTISEVTRRQTFDFLTLSGVDWSGRLAEVEFLSRLYDLTKLPSTDGRFHSADRDINTGQGKEIKGQWRLPLSAPAIRCGFPGDCSVRDRPLFIYPPGPGDKGLTPAPGPIPGPVPGQFMRST